MFEQPVLAHKVAHDGIFARTFSLFDPEESAPRHEIMESDARVYAHNAALDDVLENDASGEGREGVEEPWYAHCSERAIHTGSPPPFLSGVGPSPPPQEHRA